VNIKLSEAEVSELKKLLQSSKLKSIKGLNIDILNNISTKIKGSGKIELYVDGAADLHTKTAGIGGVIYRNGEELFSFSEYLDDSTNNEAEYSALIQGLKELLNLRLLNANIYADSELIVKQINGEYKVKNDRMQVLHKEAMILFGKLNGWTLNHIPREKNSVADKLSKNGMRSKQ
jgi:ribonuclease HI